MPIGTSIRGQAARKMTNKNTVLVVFAPFGTDEELSTFPDGKSLLLSKHPLVIALGEVARTGVHVVALIDRVDNDSILIEIPGGNPKGAVATSCWKQDMSSPRSLAGLLERAAKCHKGADIVLALEGHGAGYLPEIDTRKITHENLTKTAGGPVRWELNPTGTPGKAPVLPMGAPVLAMGAPVLPMGAPVLPTNHLPMSTWGLGEALRLARRRGVPTLRVVHLDNCFNMSAELLHTLMPHAEFASGYANYNFFTAGVPYPAVFQAMQRQGGFTAEQLARAFAKGNGDLLDAKGNHPTVGGTVKLSRMKDVAARIDRLADVLIAAMVGAGAGRAALVGRIEQAIRRAMQYDTNGDFVLDVPDQMTDLMGFAAHLQDADLAFDPATVVPAAKALQAALAAVKQYGANDRPWLVPDASPIRWNFSERTLAMNILLPDPTRQGLWDWRTPFYMNVDAENDDPKVQPHVIDFLKATDWVDFLREYHKDTPFVGLLPALIPDFPVFKADYKPGGDSGPVGGPTGGPVGGPPTGQTGATVAPRRRRR
jgi:hypothetical protein